MILWIWSSTGKKFLMALSGLVLIGFVTGHMLGNLQMFLGPEAINRYAAFLQGLGELLWIVRFGLLAMVVLHIATAVSLTLENRAARPVAYAVKEYKEATYASRTMAVSGLILLTFIIYHLMHFTLMVTHPEYRDLHDPLGRHDVYTMVVLGFSRPWISAWYLLGVFLLGMHLSHGISSFLQSLGLLNERFRCFAKSAGHVVGWGIFLGYASLPIGVLTGIIHLPPWVVLR